MKVTKTTKQKTKFPMKQQFVEQLSVMDASH